MDGGQERPSWRSGQAIPPLPRHVHDHHPSLYQNPNDPFALPHNLDPGAQFASLPPSTAHSAFFPPGTPFINPPFQAARPNMHARHSTMSFLPPVTSPQAGMVPDVFTPAASGTVATQPPFSLDERCMDYPLPPRLSVNTSPASALHSLLPLAPHASSHSPTPTRTSPVPLHHPVMRRSHTLSASLSYHPAASYPSSSTHLSPLPVTRSPLSLSPDAPRRVVSDDGYRPDRTQAKKGGPPKAVLGGPGGKTYEEMVRSVSSPVVSMRDKREEGAEDGPRGHEEPKVDRDREVKVRWRNHDVGIRLPPERYSPSDTPVELRTTVAEGGEEQGGESQVPTDLRTRKEKFPWPLRSVRTSPWALPLPLSPDEVLERETGRRRSVDMGESDVEVRDPARSRATDVTWTGKEVLVRVPDEDGWERIRPSSPAAMGEPPDQIEDSFGADAAAPTGNGSSGLPRTDPTQSSSSSSSPIKLHEGDTTLADTVASSLASSSNTPPSRILELSIKHDWTAPSLSDDGDEGSSWNQPDASQPVQLVFPLPPKPLSREEPVKNDANDSKVETNEKDTETRIVRKPLGNSAFLRRQLGSVLRRTEGVKEEDRHMVEEKPLPVEQEKRVPELPKTDARKGAADSEDFVDVPLTAGPEKEGVGQPPGLKIADEEVSPDTLIGRREDEETITPARSKRFTPYLEKQLGGFLRPDKERSKVADDSALVPVGKPNLAKHARSDSGGSLTSSVLGLTTLQKRLRPSAATFTPSSSSGIASPALAGLQVTQLTGDAGSATAPVVGHDQRPLAYSTPIDFSVAPVSSEEKRSGTLLEQVLAARSSSTHRPSSSSSSVASATNKLSADAPAFRPTHSRLSSASTATVSPIKPSDLSTSHGRSGSSETSEGSRHSMRPQAAEFVPSFGGGMSPLKSTFGVSPGPERAEGNGMREEDREATVSGKRAKLRPTAPVFDPSQRLALPSQTLNDGESSGKRTRLRPSAPAFNPSRPVSIFGRPQLPRSVAATVEPANNDNGRRLAPDDFQFAPMLQGLRPPAKDFVPRSSHRPIAPSIVTVQPEEGQTPPSGGRLRADTTTFGPPLLSALPRPATFSGGDMGGLQPDGDRSTADGMFDGLLGIREASPMPSYGNGIQGSDESSSPEELRAESEDRSTRFERESPVRREGHSHRPKELRELEAESRRGSLHPNSSDTYDVQIEKSEPIPFDRTIPVPSTDAGTHHESGVTDTQAWVNDRRKRENAPTPDSSLISSPDGSPAGDPLNPDELSDPSPPVPPYATAPTTGASTGGDTQFSTVDGSPLMPHRLFALTPFDGPSNLLPEIRRLPGLSGEVFGEIEEGLEDLVADVSQPAAENGLVGEPTGEDWVHEGAEHGIEEEPDAPTSTESFEPSQYFPSIRIDAGDDSRFRNWMFPLGTNDTNGDAHHAHKPSIGRRHTMPVDGELSASLSLRPGAGVASTLSSRVRNLRTMISTQRGGHEENTGIHDEEREGLLGEDIVDQGVSTQTSVEFPLRRDRGKELRIVNNTPMVTQSPVMRPLMVAPESSLAPLMDAEKQEGARHGEDLKGLVERLEVMVERSGAQDEGWKERVEETLARLSEKIEATGIGRSFARTGSPDPIDTIAATLEHHTDLLRQLSSAPSPLPSRHILNHESMEREAIEGKKRSDELFAAILTGQHAILDKFGEVSEGREEDRSTLHSLLIGLREEIQHAEKRREESERHRWEMEMREMRAEMERIKEVARGKDADVQRLEGEAEVLRTERASLKEQQQHTEHALQEALGEAKDRDSILAEKISAEAERDGLAEAVGRLRMRVDSLEHELEGSKLALEAEQEKTRMSTAAHGETTSLVHEMSQSAMSFQEDLLARLTKLDENMHETMGSRVKEYEALLDRNRALGGLVDGLRSQLDEAKERYAGLKEAVTSRMGDVEKQRDTLVEKLRMEEAAREKAEDAEQTIRLDLDRIKEDMTKLQIVSTERAAYARMSEIRLQALTRENSYWRAFALESDRSQYRRYMASQPFKSGEPAQAAGLGNSAHMGTPDHQPNVDLGDSPQLVTPGDPPRAASTSTPTRISKSPVQRTPSLVGSAGDSDGSDGTITPMLRAGEGGGGNWWQVV